MRVFLIAGEPSGDRLGAALIAGLQQIVGAEALELHGVGGPLMLAQARAGGTTLESLFPMEELSVMGIAEVLPKYRALKRRIAQCAARVADLKPDVLITIDSPDFCLRVAKQVRVRGPDVRTVHYVAPSVWAWRPGRARKMGRFIDQVLALLPFEPPFMEAAGMRCDFVGHPVVGEPRASRADIAAFRTRHGLDGDGPVLVVLPGSRRSEVARLAPVFGAALRQISGRHPGLRVVVPTLSHLRDTLLGLTAQWPNEPVILVPEDGAEKSAAFGCADVALAASGTVSLELAAADTPMVIAYDVNWLSRRIMQAMAQIDTFTLVNLVSDSRAVPEFIGANCHPTPIACALHDLMSDPLAAADQHEAMRATMRALGQGAEMPGLRAARAVVDGLTG